MSKLRAIEMHTVSTLARAESCSESMIRDLSKRGVLKPTRDALGYRHFSETDQMALREYLASRARQAA